MAPQMTCLLRKIVASLHVELASPPSAGFPDTHLQVLHPENLLPFLVFHMTATMMMTMMVMAMMMTMMNRLVVMWRSFFTEREFTQRLSSLSITRIRGVQPSIEVVAFAIIIITTTTITIISIPPPPSSSSKIHNIYTAHRRHLFFCT